MDALVVFVSVGLFMIFIMKAIVANHKACRRLENPQAWEEEQRQEASRKRSQQVGKGIGLFLLRACGS